MENLVTQDDIPIVLLTHFLDPSSVLPEVVVQVVDFKALGGLSTFTYNNGKVQTKRMLPPTMISDIVSGKIQNLGLIRLLEYVVNDMPSKSEEKYLFVQKCKVVASTLHSEMKIESKASVCIILKSNQEFIAKSASQIINDQKKD